MTNSQEEQPISRKSAWPYVLTSIFFAFICVYLLSIYSTVHWQICTRLASLYPDERIHETALVAESVLSHLLIYRIFAILSCIWAVLSFRGKPKWAGYIALPFALLALACFIIVM